MSVFRKLLSLAFRLNLGRAEEKAVDCKQCSSINQDTFSSEQSSYFTLSRQKKLCKEAKKKKKDDAISRFLNVHTKKIAVQLMNDLQKWHVERLNAVNCPKTKTLQRNAYT